jgi:hypothetical protein
MINPQTGQPYYADDVPQNQIQLKDKLLEPEGEVVDKEINRNIQLGNIKESDLIPLNSKYKVAKIFLEIPFKEGGAYINWVGDILLHEINFYFAASNSIRGMARLSANTNINKSTFKDETQKSNFSSLSRPGNNN